MFDVVTLYNLALSEIGQQHTVSETTEASLEAEVCNRWYPYVVETTFSQAPWPEAQAFARLALLRERNPAEPWTEADPSPEFRYLFQSPTDMVRPYHLQSYGRFHFSGRTLSCNELAPILFYIRREPDLTKWSSELFSAVMYNLAAKISHAMTGKPDLAFAMLQKAEALASDAAVRALHTVEGPAMTDPEWITARGWGQSFPQDRFFYPFAAINLGAIR